MPGSGRKKGDISSIQLKLPPLFAAQLNQDITADNPKHFVAVAVVMMVIEHAICPAVQPAMGIEDGLGLLGVTSKYSGIHKDRQFWIIGNNPIVTELKGDCL
ncbi:hypothetical protein D3C87_1439520 [compost metagenome]